MESFEPSFQQDLNGDGTIGVPASPPPTVIEAFGSTSLLAEGNNYFLQPNGGSAVELSFGGAPVVAGQFDQNGGNWVPIGAEQTANGYEVAWKVTGADQFTVWYTDSSGNYLSSAFNSASGTSATLESFEPSFQQDLNGDGTIGAPASSPPTVIEAFGSTSLLAEGSNYFLQPNGGSAVELSFGGAPVVAGQFDQNGGNWVPIGAEQTANGYEVAWKVTGADQFTVWNTDSSGNYLSSAFNSASGTSATLESFEPSFQQDLNGDGTIGVPGATSSPQFVYEGVDSNGAQLYDVTWDTLGSHPFAVRVLAPDHPSTDYPHSFLFALPVEPGLAQSTYGSGLDQLRQLDVQNQYNATIVEPIFPIDSWYADNPLNPTIDYETFTGTLLPAWIDSNFGTGGTDKNLLIGFSKSGYGALDLLFKHSSTFDAAAAWDFPADMATYDAFGSSSSGDYGTDANFQNNYRMTGNFIDSWKAPFTTEDRIWISGYDVFQADVADFDALLTSHGVLNTLSPQTLNAHTWSGGWLPDAVAGLYGLGQVDTTPPTETISTTINADTGATGTITSGGVTKDNTLGLSGTVSDAGGVSSVQIYDGATLLGLATVSSGNWSYTTPALLGGSHSFTAKATDNAGNTTTTSAVTATVDTTPPTETISTTINTDTGATGTITSGGVTKDNTLGLSGTVSDANGVSSVQIYDGATLLGLATVSSGNWSYTTAALLDGSHSFTAKATDNAGNTTTTSAVTATVDTAPPTETISTTINTDTGATGTITSGGVTKDNTLGLSGTVSDANGVSSVQIYDGATLLGLATVSSGNWSYTTPALLAGSHSFTAKASDNASNTTTTSAVTATVDTLAPTLTSIVATPATAALNAGKTVNLTANFSEVVAVGSGTPTLNLNDGGTATYVSGSSSSALTFTYTIAAGQNTSDLQVNGFNGAIIQDGAGNSANLSGITAANPVNPTGTLKIDTTAPTVISVVASPSTGTIATGKTVKINLNMNENVTVATSAGKPMLLLNDGGTATYASGSGTSSLVFNYKVPSGQGTPDLQVIGIELPASGAIQDPAGNNARLAGAAADMKLQIGSVTTNATNATISGTQTLELFGASAENIGFASGSTGTLQLDAATSYTGKVSGLALGNALDLANVAYTAGMTAGYQPNTSGPAGGLLTVGSANIALLGNYTASMFVASSDGHGGTNVVDPPLTSTTHTVAAGQVTTDLAVSGIELPTTGSIRDLAGKKARLSGADVNLGLEVNSKPLAITGSTDLQLLGPSNANVAFDAGSRGTLTFDDSQAYTGTVAGLAAGNHIDLADISFGAHTTLGYTPNDSNSGGGLTASDGSHIAKIALLGQYAAASFAMASDGHGGTLITDRPELVAEAQLTKPHA